MRRRNPDFFLDLLLVGGLGVGGYFLYKAIAPTINAVPNTVATVTNSNGAVSWAAAGVPQGDMCALINQWRESSGYFLGIPVARPNPHDYQSFRDYASIAGISTPDSPPSCF